MKIPSIILPMDGGYLENGREIEPRWFMRKHDAFTGCFIPFLVLRQVVPEDPFPEEASFRRQPGREEGLWDAEVHQASGIGTWF